MIRRGSAVSKMFTVGPTSCSHLVDENVGRSSANFPAPLLARALSIPTIRDALENILIDRARGVPVRSALRAPRSRREGESRDCDFQYRYVSLDTSKWVYYADGRSGETRRQASKSCRSPTVTFGRLARTGLRSSRRLGPRTHRSRRRDRSRSDIAAGSRRSPDSPR